MSYYGTYLKRVNRYGNTLQERIQGKKEHDFEVFKMKSPNLVRARNGEEDLIGYDAVLQTDEYDQDEVVDYLLVSLNQEIPMGTIIYTKDQRHKKVKYEGKEYTERRWINYAIDPYTSTGYNRYTVVELESELSWVEDGIKYSSFAHATGGGSGARDKNINLKFKAQFSEAGAYLPNKRYSIVMPTHEKMKKNMKITLGGETWRVAGFDNISVKGVSYVTLEETLQDINEDIPVVNASQLKNWTVTTTLGENFVIQRGVWTSLSLLFFYDGQPKTNVKYRILDGEYYDCQLQEDGTIVLLATSNRVPFSTSLKIIIDGWNEEDVIEIPFIIESFSRVTTQILGSEFLYVGETGEYIVQNISKQEFNNIYLDNDSAEIISKEYSDNSAKLIIKGQNINKNKIIIDDYKFDFEVRSMWLGGN